MKNNRGFTLVELLAVISILAILAIITLPNMIKMFNEAKKNSFTTEVKTIYREAEKQWISDSMFATDAIEYSRCQDCSGNSLKLSGRTEVDYYIKLTKAGKVVEYYVTDGTYQYLYSGNGLKIEDITDVQEIASLEPDQIIGVSSYIASLSSKVCKPATTLHTAICNMSASSGSTYYCNSTVGSGNTITYGSIVSGSPVAGNAYDCDVNNDGVYDPQTERFYYVTSEGTNAVLIYYTNVKNGTTPTQETFNYNSGGENYIGPVTAYTHLPSINEWSNPGLLMVSDESARTRQIKNELGTTTTNNGNNNISLFTYTNKAARFLTTDEIYAAAMANGNPYVSSIGFLSLKKSDYFFENIGWYTEPNGALGFWLENPSSDNAVFAYATYPSPLGIHQGNVKIESIRGGVRPVITVSLSDL